MFVVAAALLVFILQKGLSVGQFATALLVCVPLLLAGACLFAREVPEPEPSVQS
jgi:hypothetical protein